MTVGLLVGVIVFAFTNPTGNPTTGGGVLSYSNGNVGIGTPSPNYKLDVTGTFRASATSTFSGNVGIGTTTPSYKLDVAGSLNITGSYLVNGAALSVGDNLNAKTVCSSGCDYTTIQAAMNAASAGDVILVAPGTYTETVTFTQDNITLKAVGGYRNTTITQTTADVIKFGTTEGGVLEGFTVTIVGIADDDYVLQSAGDGTTANIVRDSYFALTNNANTHLNINITDGDFQFWNSKFYLANGNVSSGNIVNISGGARVDFYNCDFENVPRYVDTYPRIIYISGATASIVNIWNSKLTHLGGQRLESNPTGVWTTGGAHTVNIYNSYIGITVTSDANPNGVYIDGGSTVNSYNNVYKAVSSDDANNYWANVTAGDTLNSYNDVVLDGIISTAGTENVYGLLP